MDSILGYRQVETDGFIFLVDPISGRVLPLVRGGADGDDDGTPPENEPRTFTQEQVDAIASRARAEAKRSAANDLATELGCTVDEAKAKIAAAAAADDAVKTEAQRALEAANTAQASAVAEQAAAKAERLAARIERKLTAAGVPEATLARAARLIDVDPDADDDAITAEVDTLRTEVPALFTTGDGATPPPGIPAPKQRKSTGGKTPAEKARERFAATERPLALAKPA